MKWLWGKPRPLPSSSASAVSPATFNTPFFSPPLSDVGAHSTVTLTEHFVPTQPGPRKLVASLDCKQLTQVHGVADIVVLEK